MSSIGPGETISPDTSTLPPCIQTPSTSNHQAYKKKKENVIMKTVDDTARETAREMGYQEPRTDHSEDSMLNAQSSFGEMKTVFRDVTPGDFLNSTWNHVRSLTGGGEGDYGEGDGDGGGGEDVVEATDPEEIRCIENLEREKIVQFLQERHRSDPAHIKKNV
ncbi:hypothetical protein BO94DRAFT_621977 [Aspergillus sclerotioniger CBS 115572]|uniref:Uncharacterized protein n=1 Tax=Aspergillus sclerotioniger CBS 115572 TaxID=1450535 RepID=A0A317X5Z1_9EURO|nr:hypothetical protein BO94DRAFT_621977 [Aspergillus sclerotioniger CBS 115572]PWY93601.1 hypothetical protein BO94DRAFT_621977 [Aspergillus sclerotioniger CBS 115572]